MKLRDEDIIAKFLTPRSWRSVQASIDNIRSKNPKASKAEIESDLLQVFGDNITFIKATPATFDTFEFEAPS